MDKLFEQALESNLENGMYMLNTDLPATKIQQISENINYAVYYIDGQIVTDMPSFYVALTQVFEWPNYAGSNLDAIYDVLTEPRYYEPQKKGILVFDNFQKVAKSDSVAFAQILTLLNDIPLRFIEYLQHANLQDNELYTIYTLVRGSKSTSKEFPQEFTKIENFIK